MPPSSRTAAFDDSIVKEHRDASGRLNIALTADDRMFSTYASRLDRVAGVTRLRQLDGLDQRYWDYDVGGTTVVLHADVFAGISLHIEDGSREDLLRKIATEITEPAAALGSRPLSVSPAGPDHPTPDSPLTGMP